MEPMHALSLVPVNGAKPRNFVKVPSSPCLSNQSCMGLGEERILRGVPGLAIPETQPSAIS